MTFKDRFLTKVPMASMRADGRTVVIAALAMVAVGVLAFWSGIHGDNAHRAWQAYLINFVFWSGIAYGSVLFTAALNITNARWARPIKRLTEAPGAFVPFTLLLFWILYYGRGEIFPWIHEPVHGKEWWLNVPFLFARDGAGLLLLAAVSMALILFSVVGDWRARVRVERNGGVRSVEGVHGQAWGWRVQRVLSPVLGILYALVLSLVAIDLIMSLDPHWVSTLFGAYYFIGSVYTALAALMVLMIYAMRYTDLKDHIKPKHMHDLGKLMMGFCLLTGDFFYSQFLVIWYGNLPEETHYIIQRIRHSPWEPLAWTVLAGCFALPFITLLSRKVKMKPRAMLALSSMILVGMWLERLLLVAPSLWKGDRLPLGFMELFITAGFMGVMTLCILLFLRLTPTLPLSDPLYQESAGGTGG